MIIRDGETLVPERRTVLKHGDDLVVVTPRRQREQTEERLRQVSARGRLAQWLGLRSGSHSTGGLQTTASSARITDCRTLPQPHEGRRRPRR